MADKKSEFQYSKKKKVKNNFKLFILVFIFCSILIMNQAKGQNNSWIEINGVKWATCNIGTSGKFVKNLYDYGELYTWKEAQNVCPTGWRLPTEKEFESLINSGSVWTTINGKNGRKFGDSKNFIFFPAAGVSAGTYDTSDDTRYRQGEEGSYWSSTLYYNEYYDNYDGSYLTLGFSSRSVWSANQNPNLYGYSVRCVKE